MKVWKSLRAQMLLVSMIGVAGIGAVVLAASSGLGRAESALGDALAISGALRAHLEADMMHDALRADVLEALASAGLERGSRADIERALEGHATRFREALAALEATELPPEVKAPLREVRPALERYIEAAERIVALAFDDRRRAVDELPAFTERFEAVEAKNETVSDALQKANHDREAAAREAMARAFALLVGVGGAAAAASLYGSRRVGLRVTRVTGEIAARAEQLRTHCITGLSRATSALARGDLDVPIATSTELLKIDGEDELAALAETLNGTIRETGSTVSAFTACRTALSGVLSEVDRLAAAGRAGQLSVRGDAQRFEGRYADLVRGVNDTLEAMLAPVDQAIAVLEQLARRNLAASIDGDFRGDHARIRGALERATGEMRTALLGVRSQSALLTASSAELAGLATSLESESAGGSSRATVVAGAAGDLAANIQTIAAATEHLSTSIQHVGASAAEAATVARKGAEVATSMETTVSALDASSQQIGEVLGVIASIAAQTNLLALNATIEAARAGESGKGFAVVAREVKELANGVAKAADDVSRRVQAIRAVAGSAASATREVVGIIGRIDALQVGIARAIEEESAATREIERSVARAATSTQQVADSAGRLAESTRATADASHRGRSEAERLEGISQELAQLLARFELGGEPTAKAGATLGRTARTPGRARASARV